MNNNLLLPILAAVSVILLVWGVAQVMMGLKDDKERLRQRLSGEGRVSEHFDATHFNVVKKQRIVGGVSGAIAYLPFTEKLGSRIAQTWPSFSLAKFTFLSLGLSLMGFMTVVLVTGAYVLGIAGAAIGFGPMIMLNNQYNRHQRNLILQLPEALDFLSRVLRAGHSLSTGLQMMADELPLPLSGEFRRCYDQHSLGQSLEESLKDTAVRVDNPDFGFFVTAILIQRSTGGDLSEVLTNISDMIRQRIRLSQSVKAKTAEGRFTGYILTVFPVVMFFVSYYMSPTYASVLLHTRKGIGLMCLAGCMLVSGIFVIRKITTVKV
jgi:tight adherence protein B